MFPTIGVSINSPSGEGGEVLLISVLLLLKRWSAGRGFPLILLQAKAVSLLDKQIAMQKEGVKGFH